MEKTRNEIEGTEMLLASYERQIDVLQKGEAVLERAAQSKAKKKNRPLA